MNLEEEKLENKQYMKSKQKGFTLIEVMAVVVILGLLVSLVVPRVLGRQEQAQVQKAQIDINMISSSLTMYKLDNYNFPSTSQGLDALVSKPSGAPQPPNWRSPYVSRLPKDPWGNPYQYLQPSWLSIVWRGPTRERIGSSGSV